MVQINLSVSISFPYLISEKTIKSKLCSFYED